MTDAELMTGLADIVNEITGIPTTDVTPDVRFSDDLDVDSLSMVEIALAAEEKFGVRIPDSDLVKLKTPADAVAFIKKAGVNA
ncbi:MAG TPA: acyl carrier protein [Mycobacteriales bacterium]|nr:acyl carrier protein [Mycobacteriales bacterium]